MSRIMHLYLLDLAELKAVIGSKDEELLIRILAGPLDDTDTQLFHAIIQGGPFDPEEAEGYVDALEIICRAIGGEYIHDKNFWFSRRDFDHYELVNGLNDGSLLPQAEYSGWGYWSKEENAEELAALEEEDDLDDDPYGLIECMRESVAANKDLICFWGG
ncbi:DUF7691 family protein [Nocardia sp. NPDC055321]